MAGAAAAHRSACLCLSRRLSMHRPGRTSATRSPDAGGESQGRIPNLRPGPATVTRGGNMRPAPARAPENAAPRPRKTASGAGLRGRKPRVQNWRVLRRSRCHAGLRKGTNPFRGHHFPPETLPDSRCTPAGAGPLLHGSERCISQIRAPCGPRLWQSCTIPGPLCTCRARCACNEKAKRAKDPSYPNRIPRFGAD